MATRTTDNRYTLEYEASAGTTVVSVPGLWATGRVDVDVSSSLLHSNVTQHVFAGKWISAGVQNHGWCIVEIAGLVANDGPAPHVRVHIRPLA